MGEIVFNGSRIYSGGNEKVLEVDGEDICTAVWMYLTPLNHTLNMLKMINSLLYIFYHNNMSSRLMTRFEKKYDKEN